MEKTYRKEYFNVEKNLKHPNLSQMMRLIKNNDDFENVYVILQIALININSNKNYSVDELMMLLDNDDLDFEKRKEIMIMLEEKRKNEKNNQNNHASDEKSTKDIVIDDLKEKLNKLIKDLISLPIEFWTERGVAEHSNKILGFDIIPSTVSERTDCVFHFVKTLFDEIFNTKSKATNNRTELIKAINDTIKEEHMSANHHFEKSLDVSKKY